MSIASHPDYAEGAYDELSFWSSRFGALLFDHLELRPNVIGLDIACGTGFPLFELAHAHGPSSHFTGLDVWPDAIRRGVAFVQRDIGQTVNSELAARASR